MLVLGNFTYLYFNIGVRTFLDRHVFNLDLLTALIETYGRNVMVRITI